MKVINSLVTIIVLAVITLLFASCGENDTPPVFESNGMTISFSANESETRVSQIITTSGIDQMMLFASFNHGNFSEATSTPNYMHQQPMNKDENGLWKYSPVKYWPNNANDKLTFFAISPTPTTDNGIVVTTDATSTGYPAFTITPALSAAQQADFCVAVPVLNATYEDPDGDGDTTNDTDGQVSFNFKHAMARVKFAARYTLSSPASDFKAWIDNIEITGVIGSRDIKIAPNIGYLWDSSNTASIADYKLDLLKGELSYASLLKVGETGDDVISSLTGTLCLVPQTVPTGAKLKIRVRTGGYLEGTEGTDVGTYYTFETTLDGDEWREGESYTYNFTISDLDGKLNPPTFSVNKTWNIVYKEQKAQTFVVPVSGKYKIDIWGNQGGNSSHWGGKGGYTSGEINLTAGDILRIYIGQYNYSNNHVEGWNGGGRGGANDSSPGGSSIDLRFHHMEGTYGFEVVDTATDSSPFIGLTGNESTDSRIIVGGGGGGAGSALAGGCAGGLEGAKGTNGKNNNPSGGTQTSGGLKDAEGYTTGLTDGSPGRGGNAGYNSAGGGGGGGWYGGGGGSWYSRSHGSAGGGGSSHVNSTLFTEIIYMAGNEEFTAPGGTIETGHNGQGLVRITLLSIN